MLVDIAGPFVATRLTGNVPLHLEHLPERFGLFVILVLGESSAAVVTGLHETHWKIDSLIVAALGFTVAGAVCVRRRVVGRALAASRCRHLARRAGLSRLNP